MRFPATWPEGDREEQGFVFDSPAGSISLRQNPNVMRLGINTFLFTFPFTNQSTQWFKTFKKWGFDTVEIAIDDPANLDPAHIKAELDKAGLACGSVCGCFGPDRDLRGTPAAQKNSLGYMMKCLDQMVVLDCPSLIGPVY